MSRRRAPILAAAAALVPGFLLLASIDRWHVDRLEAERRARTQTALVPYGTALTSALNRRLALLRGFQAHVAVASRGDALPADLDDFSRSLHDSSADIRALQVVQQNRIVYTYPLQGNESVLGGAIGSATRAAPDLEQAARTGDITITGPRDLAQGGLGLIARLVVYRPDRTTWGFVALVLDLPPIFHESGLDAATSPFVFAVSDTAGQVFFGDPRVLDASPVVLPVALHDGSWRLAAVPREGWAAAIADARRDLRIAGALILLLLVGLVYSVAARHAGLAAAVHERTRDLSVANNSLRLRIAERERVERALARSAVELRAKEERLRLALRAANMVLFDWDVVNDRVAWSDEAEHLFDVRPGGLEGPLATFLARIHEADRAHVEERARAAIDGNAPYAVEYRVATAGGGRWLYSTGDVQRDEAGTAVRMMGAALDITERKNLEQQLHQSQKMEAIGTLAGGIAHDFNNVLTGIMGYGQLLLERIEPDHEMHADVEEIVHAGRRASLLTQQLLSFSRRQVLDLQVLDVNVVLRDLARLLGRVIGEDVALVLELSDSPLWVRADTGRLGQVVMNLAANARDAMPDGGTITIRTHAADAPAADGGEPARGVAIVVEDTGSGIDEQALARVFEPFFTSKPPGKGTGLGLSTVYGIVTHAGGRVVAESPPGRGARFTVWLPAAAEPTTAAAAATPSAPTARAGETVLLVEDENDLRRLTRRILESSGYGVIDAADGEAALRRLEEARRIDVLVTDVVMPNMSGGELAERVLRLRPGTRVLYMSGYTEDHTVRRGVSQRGAAFLRKPFTPDELAAAVRRALDAPKQDRAG